MSQPTPAFMLTQAQIADQLAHLGWGPGMTILVHSSLKPLGGWVPGGTQAIIAAMQALLGPSGTLMMPTFTADNSEPSYWEAPPVPEAWWPTVREVTPAFDPQTTPSLMMGLLAEHFRAWPDVQRSAHPQNSFAAWGHHATTLTAEHDLEQPFGERSPLGRLYDLDGFICLLGVGHGNNTSLHLAEERMTHPQRAPQGSAMSVDGVRQWVTFETINYDDVDFVALGAAYEAAHPDAVRVGTLGQAAVHLMRQRPLVNFAVAWLNTHRPALNP